MEDQDEIIVHEAEELEAPNGAILCGGINRKMMLANGYSEADIQNRKLETFNDEVDRLVDTKLDMAEHRWIYAKAQTDGQLRRKKLRYEMAVNNRFSATKNTTIITKHLKKLDALVTYYEMWENIGDSLKTLSATDMKKAKKRLAKVTKWGKNKTQADVDTLFSANVVLKKVSNHAHHPGRVSELDGANTQQPR